MKAETWLNKSASRLKDAGVGTAHLDVLVLLEDITNKDRAWLLAHPEFELTNALVRKLDEQTARRSKHEPLAYIRGKTEFYGREFIINKNVLEPRPESETMIDLVKGLSLEKPTIIDVGTGSGALAITAKLEIHNAKVLATDIDKKCLAVAEKNAGKLDTSVEFYHGDLLSVVPDEMLADSIILANLPYVPDSFKVNPAAMNEPKIAIFGGPDGLNIYRKLFQQMNNLKFKPKIVLTESMPPQHPALAKIAEANSYELAETNDFIQHFNYSIHKF